MYGKLRLDIMKNVTLMISVCYAETSDFFLQI